MAGAPTPIRGADTIFPKRTFPSITPSCLPTPIDLVVVLKESSFKEISLFVQVLYTLSSQVRGESVYH